jgi:hypothetical protein
MTAERRGGAWGRGGVQTMRGGFEWAHNRPGKGHPADPEKGALTPVTPRARFLAARQQRIHAVCPVTPVVVAHAPNHSPEHATGSGRLAWTRRPLHTLGHVRMAVGALYSHRRERWRHGRGHSATPSRRSCCSSAAWWCSPSCAYSSGEFCSPRVTQTHSPPHGG